LSPTPQTTLDGEFDKYNSFLSSSYPELISDLKCFKEFSVNAEKNKFVFSKNEKIRINIIRKKCDMIKNISKILKGVADSLQNIAELTIKRINIEFELRSGINLNFTKKSKLYKHKTKRSFSNQEKVNRKEKIHIINEGKPINKKNRESRTNPMHLDLFMTGIKI
jgi:hypothetical protein